MRHILAWVAAIGFIGAGFGLAGCGPREDTNSNVNICIDGEKRATCDAK